MHFGMLLDKVDSRLKSIPLQSIFVQVIGRNVRRSHQSNAIVEEMLKQSAKDHGIGNVGHNKFIKTKNAEVFGELGRDFVQRIL